MRLDTGGAYKEAKAQFRAMGIATETTLATRQHALNDITEMYRPNSRVERTLQWGADKFQLVNLLAPWTDWGKTAASMVASSEMLRAARAVTEARRPRSRSRTSPNPASTATWPSASGKAFRKAAR
jgi:hypothetical protein